MDPHEVGRIEFRLAAADDERIRRRFRRDPGRGWHWTAVAAVAIVSVGALTGDGASSIQSDGGVWRDPGSVVRGQRVLVVADDSNSMKTDDGTWIRIRDNQVESLRRQHQIVETPLLTGGWAIGAQAGGLGMVLPVEEAVARQPDLDAIYFISDYAQGDDASDDVEGRARLSRLIRDSGIRFYVATVNQPVPAAFVTLAERSGGAVF